MKKDKNEKKNKKKRNYPSKIARIIGFPLGFVLGYWLSQIAMAILHNEFQSVSNTIRLVVALSSSFLFAFLFFISAPSVLDLIIHIGFTLEKKLAKYSSKDIAGGAIGMLLGLFMAFLIGNLIYLIPVQSVAMTLIILDYILFGTLGLVFGIRKLKEIVIVKSKEEPTLDNLKIVDTSVLIDGRILQIVSSGFLEGKLIVPKFVIDELHKLSDSSDPLKRKKARRGLDILSDMQAQKMDIIISDSDYVSETEVDAKLIRLAINMKGKIITLDYNLEKVASLMEVKTLNLNALATALKPTLVVSDIVSIEIIKRGRDPLQGVGYLPDGTMVVVENGGDHIGEIVSAVVTSNIQTNAGKMIFAKIQEISV